MGDLIILADQRAARQTRHADALVVPMAHADPIDPDPWVIDFWTGIATAITLFAACINADLTKGDQ